MGVVGGNGFNRKKNPISTLQIRQGGEGEQKERDAVDEDTRHAMLRARRSTLESRGHG